MLLSVLFFLFVFIRIFIICGNILFFVIGKFKFFFFWICKIIFLNFFLINLLLIIFCVVLSVIIILIFVDVIVVKVFVNFVVVWLSKILFINGILSFKLLIIMLFFLLFLNILYLIIVKIIIIIMYIMFFFVKLDAVIMNFVVVGKLIFNLLNILIKVGIM